MSNLPHENLIKLEDKAKLLDRIVRAKVLSGGNPTVFLRMLNPILQDAEHYGFLSTSNKPLVKRN
jgi:hypothetical protein